MSPEMRVVSIAVQIRQIINLMKTQKWILTTGDSTLFKNFAESYEIPNAVIIDMHITVPWSIIGTPYPKLPRDMNYFAKITREKDNYKRKQVKYACVLLMCCERMNHHENKIRQQFDFGKELSILFNCSNVKAMIVKFSMQRFNILI